MSVPPGGRPAVVAVGGRGHPLGEGLWVLTQFPFSAIVAMEDMRLALILNAISPAIGGVLVRGEKGTAKSTAVRALTAVLPSGTVVDSGAPASGTDRLNK